MKRKILLLCAVLILALSGCQAGRERSGESGEEVAGGLGQADAA